MASVNKQSVREEVERVKAEFERLSANKKINDETKMLVSSMFMIINLFVAIFLEKLTKKDNKNSSIPSSQTGKDESSLSKKSTNGKGKQESTSTAYNTRTMETVAVAKVTLCDICGKDLSKTRCKHLERRTKIDIIFKKVVEHVDAEVKHCPDCDATVKGKFPADMAGPLQYGNGLKAYIINLIVAQMISLNRVQKLVKSIIGEVLAEASLLKFVMKLYLALEISSLAFC